MQTSVFYLPSIGSREEMEQGMAGLRGDLYQRMLAELKEQAQAADELGYDSISFTEHHFHVEGFEISNNPVLLDLFVAMHTKRIRVGQLGIVLPAQNPIRVAEDIAMLDHMSGGRANAGFARGYQRRWVDTMAQHLHGIHGATPGQHDAIDAANRAAFEEHFRIIKQCWTQDMVEFSGAYWQIPVIISGDATAWFDDATLLAPFYSRTADRGYRLLRLDGSSTFVDAVPPTPAPREISTTSADGEWRLVEDGSTAGVEETNGSRRITVPKNDTFAWSPSGHVLATGGGRCGNVPVVFVDPAAEPPTRTVDVGARITRSYQWRPDGSGIALAVILNDSQSQVLFVSAVDAALHVLVPVGTAPFRGEPSIGPWSPSGTYLLFGVYSGRPCPY